MTAINQLIAQEKIGPAYNVAPDINRFGFLNQTETTIAFDGVSIFTLAPTGTTWSYYRSGIKYTITGSKTIDLLTVENPLVNNNKYYIYIDDTLGTLSASLTDWTLEDTKVLVAIVVWNNTLTPKFLLQEERHSVLIDRREHLYLHSTRGTQYVTGGDLTGYTIATNTNAANTFAIGQSVIADEDIFITLPPVTDGDGVTANNYYIMYRTGASTWVWAGSDMPFSYTTNGYINWDNGGTLTQGTGGTGGSIRYYNTYLILTNTQGALRYVIVPGQAAFTSTTNAYAEVFANFSLTNFPKIEWVALYQMTWKTGVAGLTNKGKCQLTRAPQRITTTSVTVAQTSPVPHNSLSGLQGGATNEYYHLTSSEYAALGATVIGTDKQITFNQAGVNSGSDNLSFDYTNMRIGLGTISPSVRLQLGNDTPTTAVNGIQFGSDTSANLYRSASATLKTDGGFKALSTNTDGLQVTFDSTLLGAGGGPWLGGYKFQADNSHSLNRTTFAVVPPSGLSVADVYVYNGSNVLSSGKLGLGYDARGFWQISTNFASVGAAPLHLYAAATEMTGDEINKQFVLTTAGKIGIGTDNPATALDVVGSVKATDYRISSLNSAPASSTDTGATGEIRITADYIYVCIAANSWVRSALTAW